MGYKDNKASLQCWEKLLQKLPLLHDCIEQMPPDAPKNSIALGKIIQQNSCYQYYNKCHSFIHVNVGFSLLSP